MNKETAKQAARRITDGRDQLSGVRCAIYARSAREAQNEGAVDAQVATLCEQARLLQWRVAGVYCDRATSGNSMQRDAIQRLTADAEAGKFDMILVEGLDRISRNAAHAHTFLQHMSSHYVGVRCSAEDSGGKVRLAGLKKDLNAGHIESRATRVYQGQIAAIEAGSLFGHLPYGYRVARQRVWEIDESQADIVHRIYTALASGMPASVVVHGLNQENIPSPSGRRWRPFEVLGRRALSGIARNPIYRGFYIWGRTSASPALHTDHVVCAHPELRIVDNELWNCVQQRLPERRGPSPI